MDLFDQPEESDGTSVPEGAPRRDAEGGEVPLAEQPLAERMRPRDFSQWIGQQNVAGSDSPLRRTLEQGAPPSLIFWGPPGCGKTTLARLIASVAGLQFHPLSAVTSNIKEVKEVIELARRRLRGGGRPTLLFIDEIHRFNKAQQDAFLPHVENGTIVLVGATTENPSFSVIAPLLSRCRVLTLGPLSTGELEMILRRALADRERGLGVEDWQADDELIARLAQLSDGDARRALNLLEQCAVLSRAQSARKPSEFGGPRRMTLDILSGAIRRDQLLYDRSGEEHFNLLSAFHKSLRASDPQGAIYWMTRMMDSGEDPLVIARRLLAAACEDVCLADPQAMVQALAAYQAVHELGMPEARLPLAQATLYVATAPKSNAGLMAIEAARAAIAEKGALPVPLHLRNAPTGLMKHLGYGREYQYDHDAPEHFSGQPTLPDELQGVQFYQPGEFGFEREIQKRLEWWDKKRRERGGNES